MHRLLFCSFSLFLCTLAACQESFDQRLQRESKDYTANHCPQEAESGTRLDSLTYDMKSRTYTMWYTLDGANEEIFCENLSQIHEQLLLRVETDEKNKPMKEHQVNFRFVYRSQKSGSTIYDTTVKYIEYR